MDKESVKQFLTQDEDGKALLEELKAPLLAKRDELLSENKKLGERLTESNQRLEDTEKLHADDRAALHQTVVDGKLDELMDSYHVTPHAREQLKSSLKAKHSIKLEPADGGGRTPMIDKGEDGLSTLEEYFENWAQTDESKSFIAASPQGSVSGIQAKDTAKATGGDGERADYADRMKSAMGL